MPDPAKSGPHGDATFVRRLFIVVAIGALVGAIWALVDIILLLFGAILFAITLHACARPLRTGLGLDPRLALALSGVGMLALLAGTGFYLGPELVAEMRNVGSTLPDAANRLAGYLGLGTVTDLLRNSTAASALGGLASLLGARPLQGRWDRCCWWCLAGSISRSRQASTETVS